MEEVKLRPELTSSLNEDDENLIGGEDVCAFLDTYIVAVERKPSVWNSYVMPSARILMLFGREGSGKRRILKSLVARRGFKVKDFHRFEWKAWNHVDFSAWIGTATCGSVLQTRIIIIEDIHMLNYLHGPEYENTLMRLLHDVRTDPLKINWFVVMTCSESPGKFSSELRCLIDYECYVAPPKPEHRVQFFRRFMRAFYQHCQKEDELRDKVGFLVDLWDDEGVVSTLSQASAGCTPREILTYMQQVFRACVKPSIVPWKPQEITSVMMLLQEKKTWDTTFGEADMTEDLMTKLLKRHKGRIYITEYDPLEVNKDIRKFIDQSAEVTKDDANIIHLRGKIVDPTEQPLLSENGRKKKQKTGETDMKELAEKEKQNSRKLHKKADARDAERKLKRERADARNAEKREREEAE